LEYKEVVTSFLQQAHLILLLRRSEQVSSYKKKWDAVSGYLENETPLERARIELYEEIGLTDADVSLIRAGELLRIYDRGNETVWIVHPFLFTTSQSTIRLNRENSQYKWIDPDDLAIYETVPRLRQTYDRVRWDFSTISTNLTGAIEMVNEIDQDRSHGASYIGRKSIKAIQLAANLSNATSKAELLKDILTVAARVRTVQPNMASIRNIAGRLLSEIDLAFQSATSLIEFKNNIEQSIEEARVYADRAAELVSRNLCNILVERKCILTHSYSGTVKRALELIPNKDLQIHVTESAPTYEGKVLVRELRKLGFSHAKSLSDTATREFPIEFDAVILGADSVLTDGSVINKAGTKDIAKTARESMIPVFVAAETSKLNTMHFLGEPLHVNGIFDLTPSDCISSIITERGMMNPWDARRLIESMVEELYT